MLRMIIVAVAVLLALGSVGTALSRAGDQDPGPAIVLDKAPADAAGLAHDTQHADDAAAGDDAKKGGVVKPDNARSDDANTFTVSQPRPIKADDSPDEPEEPDAREKPDKPEKPDEPEEPDEPDDTPRD